MVFTKIDPKKETCQNLKRYTHLIEKQKLKCTMPSEWYCVNQRINGANIYVNRFQEFNRTMKTLLKNTKMPKIPVDRPLTQEEKAQLQDYETNRNNILEKYYYSEEKFLVLKKTFATAKADLVSYLLSHGLKNEASIVNSVSLKFGIERKTSQTFDFFSEFADYRGHKNVYIRGNIVLYDQFEVMYYTFLHELSHSIDPCTFDQFDSNFTNNSFQKVLTCLEQNNTVASKKTDFECFEKKYNEMLSAGKAPHFGLKTAMLDKEKGSYCYRKNYYQSLWNKNDKQCSLYQLDEVFSDWLATQVIFYRLRKNTKEEMDIFLKPIANIYCDSNNSLADLKSNIARGEMIAENHPIDFHRLNAILLNHPLYRKANHCSMLEINSQVLIGRILELSEITEINRFSRYSQYCEF